MKPSPTLCSLVASALFLVGCQSSDRELPAVPGVDVPFSTTGVSTIQTTWWTTFEDRTLNALIDQALDDNFALVAARERLDAARAVARRQGSSLLPDLNGFVGGQTIDNDSDTFGGGLLANYEIDLWGRIRASVDAERFEADALESDLQTAALTLSGQVAITWYRLVEADRSIELLRSQINANEKGLDSLKSRFRSGQVRSADILRQQQLVEATRERLTVLRSDRAVFAHQLAVLLGNAPQQWTAPASAQLPQLAALPETGLPAELLRQRPDVQASFLRLQSADSEVAAAVSNRYPRLNLTARLALPTSSFQRSRPPSGRQQLVNQQCWSRSPRLPSAATVRSL